MPRVPHLQLVPRAELPKAYQFCRDRLARLRAEGLSTRRIAALLGVKESTLKQFLKGPSASVDNMRRGSAFSIIYHYFATHDVPADDEPDKIMQFLETLDYRQTSTLAYHAIRKALQIQDDVSAAAKSKLAGVYFCFRNSTVSPFLVKSVLVISDSISIDGDTAWEFKHSHVDSPGQIKSSDGMLLAVGSNVYLIGDVDKGKGVDFIVLNDLELETVDRMTGFEISVDQENVTFFSRLACLRHDVPAAVALSEGFLKNNTGAVSRERVQTDGIGGQLTLGRSVSNYLKYEERRNAFTLKEGTIVAQEVQP